MNESNAVQKEYILKTTENEENAGEEDENKENLGEENEKKEECTERDTDEDYYAIVPPNGRWGWVVVLSAFYCNVVVDGIQLTFGIFLKAISKEFNVSLSEIALAGSLMFGIHLLMGPLVSGCNAAFGLRPVTITGSLICCFGLGISYFSTGPWYLYISFGVIGGMGLGFVYMNTLVITSLYFTTLLPLAIAIVICGTGIGTMVFAAFGSFLLKVSTWRVTFVIQAVLAGMMGLWALTFKPLKPIKVRVAEEIPRTTAEDNYGESSSIRTSIFIKTEFPNRGSILSVRTYQNLALSFVENMELVEKEEKPHKCLKCCKKRKKEKEEEKGVLVLKEMKIEDPQTHRKSYVEKLELEVEEEITKSERLKNSVSYKAVYTRFDIDKKKNRFCQSIKRTLINMLDCRLLSSCAFSVFTISGAVSLASFLIVFVYEQDRCQEDFGFSEEKSVYFVIALGGVNVFWRLALGAIAVIPKINYWAFAISGMSVAGIATMASGYNSSIYFQFGFCFVFGLGMASFAVFRIPLLIDLVGMDFIENATGINLLFMGALCIVFPPFFGWIKEMTHSYNVIFLLAGALIVTSAFMLICLKKVDTTKLKPR